MRVSIPTLATLAGCPDAFGHATPIFASQFKASSQCRDASAHNQTKPTKASNDAVRRTIGLQRSLFLSGEKIWSKLK